MKAILLFTALLNYVVGLDVSPSLDSTLTVATPNGPVKGSVNASTGGRTFYSFRAMPYAKPPVGNLRWAAPVPPSKWILPLDATKIGPTCSQRNYFALENPPIEGQEDCLYLNVYTPKIDLLHPLPVAISFHNGGYFVGRGSSDQYGPEYFMDRDMVLVIPNYRLGIFGFLTTLDDNAPGNYGVKDQILALKWIQDNIQLFGGDKNKVTIMGESAGGMSVHFLLLSPSARGLFHRGISQSGTALNRIFSEMFNAQAPAVLSKQASLVNCNGSTGNAALITCLRKVSATELLQTQDAFKQFSEFQYSQYGLVVETASKANPDPFLTKYPLEYILAGDFAHVPLIMGHVGGEGQLGAEGVMRRTATREALNADFDNIVTNYIWDLPRSTNDPEALTKAMEKLYLNGQNYVNVSDPSSIQGFLDAATDRWLLYGIYQTVMLHSALGHHPIYYYLFNYRGAYTYGDFFSGTTEDLDFKWGVCHGDELLYLFYTTLFPDLQPFDTGISKLMVNMWSNFIINGDPNPTLAGYENTIWNPVNVTVANMNNDALCYLDIEGSFAASELSVKPACGLNKERMQFWARQNLTENFAGLDASG